ncbi:sensor histidine kinase [Cloacibacterium normanense]|uniref:sensor histidine kinase n=1 Tax=Cloacibacterium normanense TaxID=237258 RepID=UPI003919FC92
MKIHRLSLFAACILTCAMAIVALAFNYVQEKVIADTQSFYFYLSISLVFIALLNYFVLELLFNSYGKKQIKRISDILPENILQEEENVNFQQLGERIQKNVSEIDMMKEMEDYRKEYIGNVSHELKTPLFSIQGYVETLKDGAVENLNIRDKYLERIGNSVERLLNIVTDLDQISKYEAAEISINYSVFDINALTKEIFDLLEIDAQKKSAKLVLQTSQTAIMVRADKQKISQVLTNLISNAIHYSNREEALIKVITKTEQEKVKIIVQDNGMGIKPEVLPRIFERFYRVETSRNRKDGGSGLGLAIVKHILEAHHQSITVESKYLEGTLFTFYLEKAL